MHKKGLTILGIFFTIGFLFYIVPYVQFGVKHSIWKIITAPLNKKDVSIAVLGIPGGTYDGSLLTDSIQVYKIDFVHKRIVAISIPRDIWSTDMKDKINAAYYYGVTDKKNPLFWLTPELKKITSMTVTKYIVVDFSKFRKVVDLLGRIEVTVDSEFTDTKYPIAGKEKNMCNNDLLLKCRYQTVYFKKGLERMNGERALIFARSRNSKDLKNGTDFAREIRQQKVISAIYSKLISPIFLLDRSKSISFVSYVDTLFEKNISLQEGAEYVWQILLHKKEYVFKRISLGDDLFTVPEYSLYDNKYVLVPKKGFAEIQTYINTALR